jgi:hypothetical protein
VAQGGRVTLLLAIVSLAGCGKPGLCGDKELVLEISGNHGHTERIEKKALPQGAGRFTIEGGSHDHAFRLKDADVEKLRAGGAVELRSTSMNAHVHELRVSCAR